MHTQMASAGATETDRQWHIAIVHLFWYQAKDLEHNPSGFSFPPCASPHVRRYIRVGRQPILLRNGGFSTEGNKNAAATAEPSA